MKRSLLMILLIVFGITCTKAQPELRKRLIQDFYSTEVEIDGKVYLDLDQNGYISKDEEHDPENFKIVPEVRFSYLYEDKNHTYLTLKFLGETIEYEDILLYEMTLPDPDSESKTYMVTDKEGGVCFQLGYNEDTEKWYFVFIK